LVGGEALDFRRNPIPDFDWLPAPLSGSQRHGRTSSACQPSPKVGFLGCEMFLNLQEALLA
jgi:hypothetical protein